MALNNEEDRHLIDEQVEAWKERCLLADGSLMFEGRAVWTKQNLDDFYERFNVNLLDDDRSFDEKLEEQLKGASPEIVCLAAETFAVHTLFARGAIGGDKKRTLISTYLSWAQLEFDWDSDLSKALGIGIGHPGQGFNTRRDAQMRFLVDFARRFKDVEQSRREALLADPWAMKEFTEDVEESTREMRSILLHLLFPEYYERIASGADKATIVAAFDGFVVDPPDDVDQHLYAIRQRLVELGMDGSELDFYWEPLNGVWDEHARGGDQDTSLVDTLEIKRQLVLYGPPGTGKTHRAKELAMKIVRRHALRSWGPEKFFANQDKLKELAKQQTHRLQLHAALSYEEFVRGPRLAGDKIVYEPGWLMRCVEEIESARHGDGDLPALPHVVILDELNRTDLSRLLGEAFSLLEDRGEEVELIGGDGAKLALPSDLYVIGTMNLIDQSVEQIDFALRRRFMWVRCGFEPDVMQSVIEAQWEEEAKQRSWLSRYDWDALAPDIATLAERAEALNDAIAHNDLLGPEYEIGHTYYFAIVALLSRWPRLRSKTRTSRFLWNKSGQPLPPLADLWKISLRPLLEQYLAGNEDAEAREAELSELSEVLFGGNGS